MSWYYAENSQKYGVNEILNFVNTEQGILLKIDMNWKWVKFFINHEGDIENTKLLTEMYSLFDEIAIDWFDSGSETFTFYDLATNTVIEQSAAFDELIEEYWNDGINAVYDAGYEEEDPELWVIGGMTLQITEPPFEL